jgi:hypothetical protein
VTLGDGTSAWVTYQSPPLDEVLRINLMIFPRMSIRVPSAGHWGDACRRLKKMALSQTGEILLRPTVGKPSL